MDINCGLCMDIKKDQELPPLTKNPIFMIKSLTLLRETQDLGSTLS